MPRKSRPHSDEPRTAVRCVTQLVQPRADSRDPRRLLDQALGYARQGWAVFPLRPGTKNGQVVSHWNTWATTDPATVREAWSGAFAGHNIGVDCGASRLVVLDLDVPKAGRTAHGVDELDALAQQHGALPATYTVTTPSGGRHLYFTADRQLGNSQSKLAPGVDVRGVGGYVLAAGSTVAGRHYTADAPAPAGLPPLPEWVYRLAATPPRRPVPSPAAPAPRGASSGRLARKRLFGLLTKVVDAPEGQRNAVLHWAACRAGELVTAGALPEGAVVRLLQQVAQANGLGEPKLATPPTELLDPAYASVAEPSRKRERNEAAKRTD